jgi:type VI secretion system protein VasD
MRSSSPAAQLLLLLCLLAAAAACTKPPPKPTVAQVDLKAAMTINPDVDGSAKPLRLRLYELKSVSAFNGADFYSLYKNDKTVLAEDLLMREEIEVDPGMNKMFSRKLDADTKYLAVFAPFHAWEKAKWGASVEMPPNTSTLVAIELRALELKMDAKPDPKAGKGKKK